MHKNQYPVTRHPLFRLSVGAVLVAGLYGCGNTKEPANASSWAEAPAAVSAEPSPLASKAASLAGKVCAAFFTQKLANGQEWVVGRPVVDGNGYPQDVVTSKNGIEVTARPPQAGEVTWYSLQGKEINGIDEAGCKQATLYPRQLTQPNDSKIWVATTNDEALVPRHWDANALDPDGFGGAGLDYGAMPHANLTEMLKQAAK